MWSSFSSGVTLRSVLSQSDPSLPALCGSFKSLQRQHLGPVNEDRWAPSTSSPGPWRPLPRAGAGGGGGGVCYLNVMTG